MKKAVLLSVIFVLCVVSIKSQIVISPQGVDREPHSSAMLHIMSDDRGVLIPRMSEQTRDAISDPANGLLIFQVDNKSGFYYYDDIANTWVPLKALTPASSNPPSSAQPGDMYFNTDENRSYIYNGTSWQLLDSDNQQLQLNGKILSITGGNSLDLSTLLATSSGSTPHANPVLGDTFYNTSTGKLTLWNGSSWINVGEDTQYVDLKLSELSSRLESDSISLERLTDRYIADSIRLDNLDTRFKNDSMRVDLVAADVVTINTKITGIAENAEVNVQSDWNQSTDTEDDFIKNKPTKLTDFTNDLNMTTILSGHNVTDLGGVTDAGSGKIMSDAERTTVTAITNTGSGAIITTAERTKLTGIAENAEVNVNADWTAIGTDAEILNKPTDLTDLSSHSVESLQDITSKGSGSIISASERTDLGDNTTARHSHANSAALNAITDAGSGVVISASERTKLTGIAENAEVNVNADWTASGTDAEILNKPTDLTDLSSHSVESLQDITSKGSGSIISVAERTDLGDNTTARHSHTNSAALNAITDAGSGVVISASERTKLTGIAENAEVNVNADWTATGTDAEILNKPTDITDLSGHNATELKLNSYSKPASTEAISADDNLQVAIGKLEKGLEGAVAGNGEVNVNADWTATGTDAEILNKPTDLTDLSSHSVESLQDITSKGSGSIISASERTKLTGIAENAEVNVNADWTATGTDAEILNKPTDLTDLSSHSVESLQDITSKGSGAIITTAERTKLTGIAENAEVNVNADWTASGTDAEILNKPTDLTDLSSHSVESLQDITSKGSGSIISASERTKLTGIAENAEVNVNADWTATGTDAEILNKPTDLTDLSSHSVESLQDITSKGSGSIISASERTKLTGIAENAEVNVNADWTASGTDAEILNKPNLHAIATSGSYNDLGDLPTKLEIDSIKLAYGTFINTISIDNTLSASSDSVITTQKAVKEYVDNKVSTVGAFTSSGGNTYLNTDTDKVGIGTNTPAQQLTITENMAIPITKNAGTEGVVYMGTQRFIHAYSDLSTIDNTFIGSESGNFNMMGNNNTGIGYSALKSMTVGHHSTAVGSGALIVNTEGTLNTAIGSGSLNSNTTGSANIAIGFEAGSTTTSGSNNILIGKTVATSNATASYELNIGNVIYGNLSTKNIGVDVVSPLEKLDVNGNIKFTNSLKGDAGFKIFSDNRNRIQFDRNDLILGSSLSASDGEVTNLILRGAENDPGHVRTELINLSFSNISNMAGQSSDPIAKISSSIYNSTSSNTGDLRFYTKDGTTLTERMIIGYNGNISIGHNSVDNPDITGKFVVQNGAVHFGSGGTIDYATHDGDLYIKDTLEVDGGLALKTGSIVDDISIDNTLGGVSPSDTTLVTQKAVKNYIDLKEKQISLTVTSDGNWDDEALPLWRTPKDINMEITEVSAYVMGESTPSLNFNVEVRATSTLKTPGNDIFASEQAANESGVDIEAGGMQNHNNISEKSHIVFTTGTSAEIGTVESVTVVITLRQKLN